MQEENMKKTDKKDDDKSTLLRISLNDDILKKINVTAPLKGFDGKKPEVVAKIVTIAINHYYKEVIVPELQNMTINE